MTICFFSTQYLPTPGGVERYTWNLALRTVRDGRPGDCGDQRAARSADHEIDADGIEIYRLPVFAAMGGRFPVLRPGPGFRALCRRLFANPIDFAVIQTRMYVESVWAAQRCADGISPRLSLTIPPVICRWRRPAGPGRAGV